MTSGFPARPPCVDTLESRRLLSFVPFGPETLVEMPSGGSVSQIDSAVARDGTYIVASTLSDPRRTTSLVVTRYTAQGNLMDIPIVLGELPGDPGPNRRAFSAVSVATDADGDSVVAYSIFNHQDSTQSLHFVRVLRDGSVSGPRLLTRGNAEDPSVSMTEDGRFFVGWTTFTLLTAEVRVAAFNANGEPLATRFTAAYTVGSVGADIHNLSLSAAPDGSSAAFAYTFFEDADLFPLYDVYHGRVSTSAVIDDATVLPSDHTDNGHVAMLADGSYYVGYDQFPFVNFTPVYDQAQPYVQKFDSNGDPIGQLIPVGAALGDDTHLSDLAAISDGGFAVALHQGTDAATTIYTHRFLPSGISDGSNPIRVATSQSQSELDGYSARIAADHNGTALVSYIRRTDIDPIPGEISYRRLTAQPAAIDRSVLYLVATDDAETFDVRPKGQSIVVTYEHSLNPAHQEVRRFDPSLISQISSSLGNGDDSLLNRTAFPSSIDGGNGDDLIVGGSSRDRITGGASDDSLYGGDGDDLLYGQDNEDFLFGGNGNDSLNGGAGTDILRGEAGNDFLQGTDGITDSLFGHDGRDTAHGNSGDILRDIEVVL